VFEIKAIADLSPLIQCVGMNVTSIIPNAECRWTGTYCQKALGMFA